MNFVVQLYVHIWNELINAKPFLNRIYYINYIQINKHKTKPRRNVDNDTQGNARVITGAREYNSVNVAIFN